MVERQLAKFQEDSVHKAFLDQYREVVKTQKGDQLNRKKDDSGAYEELWISHRRQTIFLQEKQSLTINLFVS